MIRYFLDGGIFMWPILIESISVFSIILEKIIYYFQEGKIDLEKKKKLHKLVENSTKEEIFDFCKEDKSILSKFISKVLEKIDKNFDNNFKKIELLDIEFLENVIEINIVEQEQKIEKRMWLLKGITNSAPSLGLLGTVTGMIASFAALTSEGTESARMVANGISEALYTTAFGLIVAIPTILFYDYFNKKNNQIIFEIEKISIQLLNRIKIANN